MRALRGARQLACGLQRAATEVTRNGVQAAEVRYLTGVAALRVFKTLPASGAATVGNTHQALLREDLLPSRLAWGVLQARQLRVGSSALFAALEVTVPPMGESVSEGTISNIIKRQGDAVQENDVIAQIETDKVTLDIKYTGKEPGVITALHIKEADVVQTGKPVATVEPGGTGAAAPAAEAAASPPPPPKTEAAPKPPPAPKPAPKAAPPPPPPPPPPQPKPQAPAAPAAPTGPVEKPERRVKMTRLRQRVAERLKGAQNTYAMLSTFNEVDMTSLMEIRSIYKDAFFEKHGVKLGFMSAFIKASAYALGEVPAVNAVIEGDEIVYRDYVDISIAVATPKGLVVPVLRNADKLSFATCEKKLNELGKKARDGTISIDDMAGGTFTISNGGVYGSLLSTPIINPPQSAILGMHAITQRPMVVGGKIEARPVMNIALTYDHRLIDGREAVTFLKRIKEVVEDPRRLLIDC